jgi:exosome complex component RRP43
MESSSLLSAEVLRVVHPKAFLRKFVEKHVRPDYRGLFDFRNVLIYTNVISSCQGSALIRLGQTSVICRVRTEVTQPRWDFPEKGYIGKNSSHQEQSRTLIKLNSSNYKCIT